jgi:hypothetical protein
MNVAEAETTEPRVVDLNDMSLADLTSAYNEISTRPVSKFRSVKDGQSRLAKVLEKHGATKLGDGIYEYDVGQQEEETEQPAGEHTERQIFVPSDLHAEATVHLVAPRAVRPGSGAEADLNVFKEHDGSLVTDVVKHLKTRWSAIRYWSKKGVIELRNPPN